MPQQTIQFKDFKGVDTRKSILTTPSGSFLDIEDGFINDGKELEQRKAWNVASVSNANVFGLETTATGVFVFGSNVDPGGWTNGITYQRLQHPAVLQGVAYNPALHAMTGVVCSTSFGQGCWVVATFADGASYVYWNGLPVYNFINGIVLTGLTSTTSILTALVNYVTSLNLQGFQFQYITNSGGAASIYLVVPPNVQLSFNTLVTSAGGALSVTNVVPAKASGNFLANGSFTINAAFLYRDYTNTNYGITAVKTSADGYTQNLLTAPVYTNAPAGVITTLPQFAAAVASAINANAANLRFTATSFNNTVILTDKLNTNTALNGVNIQVATTNFVCIDNTGFHFTGAWANGDTVSAVNWDSTGANVQILNSTVTYGAAHPAYISGTAFSIFMQRIAFGINNGTYTAVQLPSPLNDGTYFLYISRAVATSASSVSAFVNTLTFNSTAGAVVDAASTPTTYSLAASIVSPNTKYNLAPSVPGTFQYTMSALATGGTGPYTYQWILNSNGSAGTDAASLSAGASTISCTITVLRSSISSKQATGSLQVTVTDSTGASVVVSTPITF